jgi:hypothetical protein
VRLKVGDLDAHVTRRGSGRSGLHNTLTTASRALRAANPHVCARICVEILDLRSHLTSSSSVEATIRFLCVAAAPYECLERFEGCSWTGGRDASERLETEVALLRFAALEEPPDAFEGEGLRECE